MFARRGTRTNRRGVGDALPNDPIWWQIPGAHTALRSDFGLAYAAGVSMTWTDQITGTATFAQATAAQVPTYAASDAQWGGLPSITFDGTNDNLDSSLAASSWKLLHDGTGVTILAVFHPLVTGGGSADVLLGTTYTGIGAHLAYDANSTRGTFVVRDGGVPDVIQLYPTTGTMPGDVNYAMLATHATADTPDGSLYYPLASSVATGSGTPTAADPGATASIGCSPGGTLNPYAGSIVELVVWPFSFTLAQRTRANAYVRRRYKIT